MGLTKLNFNEIENASETSNTININKTTILNQEVILPTKTPTVDESNGTVWVDPTSNNLKIKINSVIYDLSFQTDYNNISITSPGVISLNGITGIINNLTISGSGTVLEIRSSSIGGTQWSNLEILGDLNIASGCTLKLTRVPLIVRGSIIGSGIINSPDGANGGVAGVGGPGGVGGRNGHYMAFNVNDINNGTGESGTNSPSSWSNQYGGSSLSMPIEYGVSSGSGGPGGRGTAGGGGGGWYLNLSSNAPGGASGNGYSGGTGYDSSPREMFGYYITGGGAGGGAGGLSVSSPENWRYGGPASTGVTGSAGGSAGVLSSPYTGIGTPSTNSSGSAGTSGGAGGDGLRYDFTASRNDLPTDGSTGGNGGNGGAGGGNGGAHISVYSGGPISTSINIRPGKGGLTGGSTSLPRAQTGSLWLFTPTGSETISGIDLTGASGTPTGPNGVSNRYAISNSTEVSNFFTGILYEADGVTPAKTKVAITYL
jgi:hypothetical protein